MNISFIVPSTLEPQTDTFLGVLRDYFPHEQIIVAYDVYCYGKGWAIRDDICRINHEIIIFIDGDMDIHPREVNKLLPFIYTHDVVIGVKKIGNLPFKRKIISLLTRLFNWIFFGLWDTQTGLKLYHKSTMPTWETNGFAFDMEMLYKAKLAGLTIKEVPIECNISSNMPLKTVLKTLKDALRIWLKHQ